MISMICMTSDNVVSVPGEVVTTRDSPQLSVGWMSQVTMQGQGAGLLHTDTHTAPALSTVSCCCCWCWWEQEGIPGRGNIQIKICRQRCYWSVVTTLHAVLYYGQFEFPDTICAIYADWSH